MLSFLYFFFWVVLIRIVWVKSRKFFWPVFVGIVATPFIGTIWAVMMEDERYEKRKLFRS